jgi:hypothetical protein
MHKSGEAVAYIAIGGAQLNADVSNDTLTVELFQKRVSLSGKYIEVRHVGSYSEREHFLHSWIGKACDVVDRYRHSYRGGIEYALQKRAF